jgi:hypothetical protein
MPSVYKRESVRRDLVQHFVRLAEEAGIETDDRFLASAEQTFEDLAGSAPANKWSTRKTLESQELRGTGHNE